jgi:hypothetical protein
MSYEEKLAMYEEMIEHEECPVHREIWEDRKYSLMFAEVERRLAEFVGPKMEIQ